MWNYIRKWWILKTIRVISKKAIISCGFAIVKTDSTCTLCSESIVNICKAHTAHSGEVFVTKKVIGGCCLRCRWYTIGKTPNGPDNDHPPLETFLLENGISSEMHRRFNPKPYMTLQLS